MDCAEEEKAILTERAWGRFHPSKLRDTWITAKLCFFLAIGVGMALYHNSYADEIMLVCPCCQNMFELQVDMKEIPGAGWTCDNCGMFQCHGQKCVYCGASRKKK